MEKKQKQINQKGKEVKFKYLFNKVKDKFVSLSEAGKKQKKGICNVYNSLGKWLIRMQ